MNHIWYHIEDKNIKNNEDIIVYFSGNIAEVYQLKQWWKVFEALHEVENIRVVVSSKAVCEYLIRHFSKKNGILITFIKTSIEVLNFYQSIDVKVVLYVNNNRKNFHSLAYNKALHVHLNHGESEKSSMYSNQSKSYDYTLVVGDAAIDRYKRHMINIKRANYEKIGRPQFDHIQNIKKTIDKKVILYAPTDESTHISMRYTSLEKYGLNIVNSVLSNENYFLVYRPHPRTGKNSDIIKNINKEIIDIVNSSDNASLEVELEALDLLSIVDIAIFDNSSLIIDFLYFNRPMFATDMFIPEYHNKEEFKMLDGCIMLNDENINDFRDILEYEINNDSLSEKRAKIKKYYLGDYKKGESTKIFINKIKDIIKERDRLIEEKENI